MLRPFLTLLFCRPHPKVRLESDGVIGTMIGLLAAMCIPVGHEPLPPAALAPAEAVLC